MASAKTALDQSPLLKSHFSQSCLIAQFHRKNNKSSKFFYLGIEHLYWERRQERKDDYKSFTGKVITTILEQLRNTRRPLKTEVQAAFKKNIIYLFLVYNM